MVSLFYSLSSVEDPVGRGPTANAANWLKLNRVQASCQGGRYDVNHLVCINEVGLVCHPWPLHWDSGLFESICQKQLSPLLGKVQCSLECQTENLIQETCGNPHWIITHFSSSFGIWAESQLVLFSYCLLDWICSTTSLFFSPLVFKDAASGCSV